MLCSCETDEETTQNHQCVESTGHYKQHQIILLILSILERNTMLSYQSNNIIIPIL